MNSYRSLYVHVSNFHLILGADPFGMPSNLTANMNDKSIRFNWTHPTMEIVDHFNVLVTGSSVDQLFKVNSTEFVVCRFPDPSFNVSLSAVDICGRESASTLMQGNNIVHFIIIIAT